MTYHFTIDIKPCINFHTHAAEVSATDHTYNGLGKGILVRQKHIESFTTNNEAEQAAEQFCQNLHNKLVELVKKELSVLKNAEP